jgi:peptidoglycan/xylan/chitin deacetylase (PgdA/CDA1 family)
MSNPPRHMAKRRSRRCHPTSGRLPVLHRAQRFRLGLVVAAAVVVGTGAVVIDRRLQDVVVRPGDGDLSTLANGSGASGASGGSSAAPTAVATTTTTAPRPTPQTLVPLPDEPGLAPVITRIETDDPVVFLTIDDGLTRLPEGLALFQEKGIPASLFLVNEPVESDPGFFQALPGTLVESHTQTHRNLRGAPQAEQEDEICGNAEVIERTFGRRPTLFRPPFGNYDEATRRAAANCGMRAVVIWQENVNYDVVGFRSVQHFRPGDIILMHFRPSFVQELNVIEQRVEEAGLRFALLEDYLDAR